MANRLNDIFNPDALAEAQDYANSLNTPVPQGYVHTYRPGWDASLVAEQEAAANPLVFAPAITDSFRKTSKIINDDVSLGEGLSNAGRKLLGIGQERYQTWPEKIFRSGFSLPHDVVTGEVPVRDADGRTSSELIERTQDLSGLMGGGFTAKPNALVAAAESSHNAPIAALANAPRFYSALEHAVNNSKMPKADADQWLGYLRNQPGVKAEELDWVLHELPKGQISKTELEQFVKDHKVELKEVNKQNLPEPPNNMVNYLWSSMGHKIDHIKTIEDLNQAKRFNANFRETVKGLSDEKAMEFVNQTQEYAKKLLPLENVEPTKYSQWQLPGGENYKEMLLQLPIKKVGETTPEQLKNLARTLYETFDRRGGDPPWERIAPDIQEIYRSRAEQKSYLADNPPSFQHSHWDEPNVLAHIRMNDRNVPGVGNTLHIEEIQSDWHQAGRKQGYKGEAEKLKPEFDIAEKKIIDSGDESVMSKPELKDALKEAVDKKIITADEAKIYARYVQIENTSARQPVPDAPFKASWPDLALKRVIRQAAEQGKDSISWTPGEAQAARYDLSKQINSIRYNTDEHTLQAFDKKDSIVINQRIAPKDLPDHIGKEAADKIINAPTSKEKNRYGQWHALSGLDLKVGGEGMKAFYDKMLVDKANAIAKKFGGKVETDVDLNTGAGGAWDKITEGSKQKAHILRITPQLRDAALNKGFSLFADTGKVGAPLAALTKIDHNPFEPFEVLTAKKYNNVQMNADTEVLKNPSSRDFRQFAKENDGNIRTLSDKDENIYVWNSNNGTHEGVANSLGLKVKDWGNEWFSSKGKLYNKGDLRQENFPNWLKSGLLLSDTSDNAALTALAKQHNVKLTPVAENPFTTDAYHGSPNPLRGDVIEPLRTHEVVEFGNNEFGVRDKVHGETVGGLFKTKKEAEDFIAKRVGSEFYSAANPGLASDYALHNPFGKGKNVTPLKIDTSEYHSVDAKGHPWDWINTQAIKEAEQLGKKGVIVKNVRDDPDSHRAGRGAQTVYITLDPSTVRSKFAKFDPAKFGESGLLKASGLPIYSDDKGNQLIPPPPNPARIAAMEPPEKAIITIAGKAAEWGLFALARNSPRLFASLNAAWGAQLPAAISQFMMDDIRRQVREGKSIADIKFEEGSLGDMWGAFSSLEKKYGKAAAKLTPVAENPFNAANSR